MVRIAPWLSEGWALFSRNTGAFVLATLLVLLGTIFTCTVLWLPLTLGMDYMVLGALQGRRVGCGEISFGFQRFGRALLLWLVGVGILLLSARFRQATDIPWIIIQLVVLPYETIISGLAGYLIVDRDEGFGMALWRSFQVIQMYWLTFWLCGLLFWVISLVGSMTVVGGLVTTPWIQCALGIAYRDLFGTVPGHGVTVEAVPPSGA